MPPSRACREWARSGGAMGRPLVVLGTYDLAHEVADLVEEGGDYEITHFAENRDRSRVGTSIRGRPVIWVDDLRGLAAPHRAVCAIATTTRRAFTDQARALGMGFATVAHPSACVLPSARVGDGCILSVHAVVASRAVIGNHVFLNRGATVGHQTVLGDHCTVNPGAHVAGRCVLGARVVVGMGALVLNNLRVGVDAVPAAGAV